MKKDQTTQQADEELLRAGFQDAGEVFMAIHIEAMFHQIEDENQRFMHNLMASHIEAWIPAENYRAMIKDVARVILDHSQRSLLNEQGKSQEKG